MSDHRIIEYINRQPVSEQVFSHPALDGLSIRGFIASDDRTSGIVIEPLNQEEE
jgi:hypothetical protein